MPRPSLPGWPANQVSSVAHQEKMTPLRSAAGAAAWLAALCLAVSGAIGPAQAQSGAFRTSGEGLNFGRFIVYPALGVEFMYDSNVRYASEDLFAEQNLGSGEIHLLPRIMVDLPIGESRVRWVYAPIYRNYTNNNLGLKNQFSHYFDLEAMLHIGHALRLGIREHYVNGTEEVREAAPGGELTFGLTPFVTHEPSLLVELDLGARHGVSVSPRYTHVTFDETLEAPLFGYTTTLVEGRYNYRISSADTLFGYLTSESTDQRRGSVLFPDMVLDGRGLGVGVSRMINQDVTTSASVGYKRLTFGGGAASDFSGMVADINASLQLSDQSSMALAVARLPYQSFFLDQGYYVDQHVEMQFLRYVGHNVYWAVGGSIGSNSYADKVNFSVQPDTPPTRDCDDDGVLDGSDCNANGLIDILEVVYCEPQVGGTPVCPSEGVRRRDKVGRFEIGLGYKPLRTLGFFIGYNGDIRRTNIEQAFNGEFFDPFKYDINRILFRIEVGWR